MIYIFILLLLSFAYVSYITTKREAEMNDMGNLKKDEGNNNPQYNNNKKTRKITTCDMATICFVGTNTVSIFGMVYLIPFLGDTLESLGFDLLSGGLSSIIVGGVGMLLFVPFILTPLLLGVGLVLNTISLVQKKQSPPRRL